MGVRVRTYRVVSDAVRRALANDLHWRTIAERREYDPSVPEERASLVEALCDAVMVEIGEVLDLEDGT